MKQRCVSIGAVLQLGLFLPAMGLSQADSLVDCFPLSVGNQWTYAFSHLLVVDIGAGFEVTTDTGRAVYSVIGRTVTPDSITWLFRESRTLHHHVQIAINPPTDSLIVDSTLFEIIELTTGRHQLHRRITDQSVLWTTVLPFMRDMSDTTRMYRYWRVDSTLAHVFIIQYPSPYPLVSYSFTVTQDSGMVSLGALNAITFPGYERADHHLVAQMLTEVGNEPRSVLPRRVSLQQNYPNPFNPSTTVLYELPAATHVQLHVFNMLGELVLRLVDRDMPAGRHQVDVRGGDLSSGTYLLVLGTTEGREIRKMLLIR